MAIGMTTSMKLFPGECLNCLLSCIRSDQVCLAVMLDVCTLRDSQVTNVTQCSSWSAHLRLVAKLLDPSGTQ